MAACHSLICLFSLSLLLLFNTANCQAEPPSSTNGTTQDLGPYGSRDVENIFNWRFTIGENETIKSLIVRHDAIVDAIGFAIIDGNGDFTIKEYGNINARATEVKFSEGETIVQISGRHGLFRSNARRRTITQIRISTNMNLAGYGPYGSGNGLGISQVENFQSPLVNSGDFVGLFGTIGADERFVESIGLTVTSATE